MSKHTPGPWVVEDDLIAQPANADDSVEIAYMMAELGGPMTADVRRANANLIAAAPDMYEALKSALAAMEHMGGALNGMDAVMPEDEGHLEAFEKARAALRKAEGEEE